MNGGGAVFDNGEKLLARLCFLNEKLSGEQAAGILFAVRHTHELRKTVVDLCSRVLDSFTFSRVDDFAAKGRIDPHTVF